MMCGLLVPTSGKALVLGMDLRSAPARRVSIWAIWRKNFRCTATSASSRTCAFLRVYGLRGRAQNDKIARMSDAFGLNSIARHAADELPLGYKQRLALACSLMHEPDILFLDEPTSGVDPSPVASSGCISTAWWIKG